MNDSASIFRDNLSRYYTEHYLNNPYGKMAADLDVALGTLKCWMSGKRVPTLLTIKELADKFGCPTYRLIEPSGTIECADMVNGDIHDVLTERLQIVFLERGAVSVLNKLNVLNFKISQDSLTSYLRRTNFRLPTLRTLDRIADELKINSFELLKED